MSASSFRMMRERQAKKKQEVVFTPVEDEPAVEKPRRGRKPAEKVEVEDGDET